MQASVCEHRQASEDGRITCAKIVLGDNQVSPDLCSGCPARARNCQHLRFSLQKHSFTPITVRWGNGHVERWDDVSPSVSFVQAACHVRTIAVSSPRDCLSCQLREALHPEQELPTPALESIPPAHGHAIPFVRVAQ